MKNEDNTAMVSVLRSAKDAFRTESFSQFPVFRVSTSLSVICTVSRLFDLHYSRNLPWWHIRVWLWDGSRIDNHSIAERTVRREIVMRAFGARVPAFSATGCAICIRLPCMARDPDAFLKCVEVGGVFFLLTAALMDCKFMSLAIRWSGRHPAWHLLWSSRCHHL